MLLALGALGPPLELTVMIGGMTHLLARPGHRLGLFGKTLLGRLRRGAHRISLGAGLLKRHLARRELGTQCVKLGAAAQRTGSTALTWKPNSTTWIDECPSSLERTHPAEQGTHPIARGRRRFDRA